MKYNDYKSGLAKAFSIGSKSYDKWAQIQKRIARELLDFIPEKITPGKTLDVGCGTGMVIDLVKQQHPHITIKGVDISPRMIEVCENKWINDRDVTFNVMDIETLQPDDRYDLILSNCCFQWFLEPQRTLSAIQSILKNNGYLAFSLLTEDSYSEIRESMEHVHGNSASLLQLPSFVEYLEILESLKFRNLEHYSFKIVEEFPNAFSALKSLNKIGASLKFQNNYKPQSIAEIKKICSYYEKCFSTADSTVCLTHHVTLFLLEK